MRSCSAPRSRHWRTQQRPISNAELEFPSIAFRQGYIKLSVRQEVVEHIDPMMTGPLTVRPATDLMRHNALPLTPERENTRRTHARTQQSIRSFHRRTLVVGP